MKIGMRLEGGAFQRIEALVAAVRRRAVERAEAERAARAEVDRGKRPARLRTEPRSDGARR